MLTSTTVFSQGWGNGNRNYQNQNGECLNRISGLTEKQQTQIQEMEDKHHEGMAEFRTKQRSTNNAIQKSELRTEMLKKVEAHRNSVKKVLTANQQKQYEQLHAYRNNGHNQQFANGRRGNGGGQFAQGNRNRGCPANMNFRSRGANFQNGKGSGNNNMTCAGNTGNTFRGRNRNSHRGNGNGNFQRGNGRFQYQNSRVGYGAQNISDEGIEVIE